MEPVSVLHLVPELTPGGRDRLLLDLLSRLDPQLFRVSLATLGGRAEIDPDDPVAARLRLLHPAIPITHAHLPLPRRVLARSRDVDALRTFLRFERPQIVHTHGAMLNAWGGIAARLAGVPHLMSHDHEPPAGPWRERLVQRWAARLPDVAFVASRTVAAERNARLHRRGARILSLPTGVDLRTFVPATPTQRLAARLQLGVPGDAFLVGVVGRLLPRKRADVLVDALPALLANVPQARLVIAGTGPEEARLAAQARDLGVESQLLAIPWQRDVATIYRALDVFVTLTETGSGRTLAEAMACGLPVVALRTPLHVELAHETSVWVEPRPRAVAHALGQLARSVTERSRLGVEARTRAVRSLDVDAAARLLETAYAHSVGRTPRPHSRRELLPSR